MSPEAPARRFEVIQRLVEIAGADTAFVSTTGMCSRELFTLSDRENNFYVVGGMGCALPIGLGIALNDPGPTVVMDGDGALLMRMGSLATVGHCAPRNLIHVVLDNGAHDSTGGQSTVSPSVDFAGIALNCGYAFAATCQGLSGFEEAYRMAVAKTQSGPALIRVHITPGPLSNLGRPTIAPPDVALRFQSFLAARAARLTAQPGAAR
jgi:phosphonopyruvate decarboxylase